MLAGFLKRRECWTLTWLGRLTLLALVIGGCAFGVTEIHPFLSVTVRVPAQVLVIEGWMPPSAMKQAAEEFRSGGYQQAVLIRPVIGLDNQYEFGQYIGNRMSALLVQYGVPKERLTTLFPTSAADKDRTYHASLAVKQWLAQHGFLMTSIDVASQGPHARRSRLLYQKAFGDRCKVGIIALQDLSYDPAHWWGKSAGVREVIGESIAYLYARFWFNPGSQ